MPEIYTKYTLSDYHRDIFKSDFGSFFTWDKQRFEELYGDRILMGGVDLYNSLQMIPSFKLISATGDAFISHHYVNDSTKITLHVRSKKISFISKVEYAFWRGEPIQKYYYNLTIDEFFATTDIPGDLKEYVLFNMDKVRISKAHESDRCPCFVCGRLMESSMDDKFIPQKADPISGGISIVGHCGYGSMFDMDRFKIAICDICMLESLASNRVIEHFEG